MKKLQLDLLDDEAFHKLADARMVSQPSNPYIPESLQKIMTQVFIEAANRAVSDGFIFG